MGFLLTKGVLRCRRCSPGWAGPTRGPAARMPTRPPPSPCCWRPTGARFSGRRLARDALVAVLAFGYCLWAIAGPGYEVVFKGFLLLLAGIPVSVWLRWRATRTPAEAAPLTVEDLLPPIADKQPVRT